MLLERIREEVVSVGISVLTSNLTKGTGGNLSVCDRESGLMAITPSGVDYTLIRPEDIVLIDVQTGRIVEGEAVPSSECDMHRIFYKYRDDVDAIIHTHTPFATAVSCLNHTLPALHYLVAFAGVDVPCAEYATYGTVQLAKNAFKAMEGRKACLLANHGLIVGGKTLAEAYAITEQVEFCCELYARTKAMGEPVILPLEEMERMIERFKNYGKRIEEHEEI